MPGLLSCCVEDRRARRAKRQAIVAFLQVPSDKDVDDYESLGDLAVEVTEEMREQLLDLRGYMKKTLPAYMVPSLYVPMANAKNVAQKMERKVLQQWLEKQPVDRLEMWSLGSGKAKTMPAEEKDVQMQALWVEVLGILAEDIGVDDSFFAVGGDSIGKTLSQLVLLPGRFALPSRSVKWPTNYFVRCHDPDVSRPGVGLLSPRRGHLEDAHPLWMASAAEISTRRRGHRSSSVRASRE